MIVVSDSTVLIGLGAIGGLDWLKQLYELVIVPTAVYEEVTVAGAGKPGAQAVAAATWIQLRAVNNQHAVAQLINLVGLDEGESEAIILAQEISADLLLLDEAKARRYARQQHLTITGTLGIVLAAKETGLIARVRPQLDALFAAGIFLDSALYQTACQMAGE